jgi:hypothetical protein
MGVACVVGLGPSRSRNHRAHCHPVPHVRFRRRRRQDVVLANGLIKASAPGRQCRQAVIIDGSGLTVYRADRCLDGPQDVRGVARRVAAGQARPDRPAAPSAVRRTGNATPWVQAADEFGLTTRKIETGATA